MARHHNLTAKLGSQPGAFDFFQAVRILERRGVALGRAMVGGDSPPEREALHFRVQPGLRFASSAVATVTGANDTRPDAPPPELTTTFLGLTGSDGIMPQHYTTLILSRLRQKDTTLRDWLDQFHHRLLSLFVRAWEKTHLPAAVEQHRVQGASGDDPFARGLFSLAGFGTDGLRDRLRISNDTIVYYSGLLARQPRTASGLEQVLGEFFGWPVTVQELSGHWLYLDLENKAQLQDGVKPGRNVGLGRDVIIGQRVWDVQSKVRLVIGPLEYSQFRSLLPGGSARGPLRDLARLYLGLEIDADVQIVLKRDAVPWCELEYNERAGPRLGWNTWVRTHNFGEPVGDAVFPAE